MSSFYYVTSSNSNDKWLNVDDTHILQREITTIFKDENDNYYQVVLDAGFQCDGLSVPKMFSSLIRLTHYSPLYVVIEYWSKI